MAAPFVSPDPSDVASLESEWSVLLECASPRYDRQRLLGLLRSVNWTRLLLLAEEHGVNAQLAACLRDLDSHVVPPEVRQTLIDCQRARTFFTLRLTAELFRILERLTFESIGVLVVKGPVLAVRAYGDPAMRSYGDIDLLVRQRDIRRATELLSADGFTPAVSLTAIDAGKIPGQYLFSRRDSGLIIELHNDRTLRYFPRRLPLEQFFQRKVDVLLDARTAPAPSVEDELVLICIHGAKHFWERLMWIADVAALATRQTDLDWERVAETARAVAAERMLHTGLRLAVDLLRTRLPDRVQAVVRADELAARLADQVYQWLTAAGNRSPGLFERAAFRLRMRGGLIAAPAYLLRLSFSPTEEDWYEGGHHFLGVLRRPFRLVRKYGRHGKS